MYDYEHLHKYITKALYHVMACIGMYWYIWTYMSPQNLEFRNHVLVCINTCHYMPIHDSWILGFLGVYMSIYINTCQYILLHVSTSRSWYMLANVNIGLTVLFVNLGMYYLLVDTFCICIHAPLEGLYVDPK
jgi:hypothetical protein